MGLYLSDEAMIALVIVIAVVFSIAVPTAIALIGLERDL